MPPRELWNLIRQTVPTIEAILELRQVTLRIFRLKRVITASQ